jgi:hypothetical protein
MTLDGRRNVSRWRRTVTTAFVAAGMAVAMLLGTPATANADVLDDLAREFSTAAGAGQVANLLSESMKIRAMGIKPTKAELAGVEDALRYRPNMSPLIEALQSLVGGQSQRLQQAQSIAQQQGGGSLTINQYDPSNPTGVTSGGGSINLGGGNYTIGSGRGGAVSGSGPGR